MSGLSAMPAGAWHAYLQDTPLPELMAAAAALRERHPASGLLSYSPKVFIPLTRLCRDVCHYCSFATVPSALDSPYLEAEAVLQIARAGAAAGCREALITLGERPEMRYRVARDWLTARGYGSTLDYIEAIAARILADTGLLPHINAGVLDEDEYRRLRRVAPSMGLMLESTSQRLCARGGPHFGSPDKLPARRLASLQAAGRARVPMTTGLLIGIGETRGERIDTLLAIRALHEAHGHIQEVIVQNFVPKPGTPMAAVAPVGDEELLWTVAAARLILGAAMHIQVPPNLNAGRLDAVVDAGIDDWGGISPLTPDHINPESPWPQLAPLAALAQRHGKLLTARLTVYPEYIRADGGWLDAAPRRAVLQLSDAEGYARDDSWRSGLSAEPPPALPRGRPHRWNLDRVLDRAGEGERLDSADIVRLFAARGSAVAEIAAAADALRRRVVGDTLSYVVNRNINYTNLCMYRCSFCAFSKGRGAARLRGPAYRLDLAEVAQRAHEAAARGATEVCMQGGIHPEFDGETYLSICRTVKQAVPWMHVHAFSPLEVWHGAQTLGIPLEDYLERLQQAGLGSLPGTAAEILDDRIRAQICPDKLNTGQWLQVIEAAHRVGLKTTATIMFGHLEAPDSWAAHLLHIRDLQARSGGFTEFVPLPFVAQEAPMYQRGLARPGPTWREALLMHAVARLVLHPLIRNIQASWVKLGPRGVERCLDAGVNDLGGTLMDESISRSAGAQHGQELTAGELQRIAAHSGRVPKQRTTLYAEPQKRAVLSADGASYAPLFR